MSGMKRLAEQYHAERPKDWPGPDLFEAQQAQREALEQVAKNSGNFMTWAYMAVQRLPVGLWTGEEVRLALEAGDIRPHHHNAWGALISKCVKDGLLKPTGRYLPMRTKKSHARKTPEYVR